MENVFSLLNQTDSLESDFTETQALLPTQFYGPRRGASNVGPLRRLMTAMLVDAVRCFQAKAGARQAATRQEFDEVRSWLFSDDGDGLFSFRSVCGTLQIDPKSIRSGLVRWQKQRVADAKPRFIRRLALTMKPIS
jgi:hypothetical protein